MSSTIFTATSGTSISVDPHADVEGAGQQNPAVPHDAQNGAPAPGNPPNEDLVQAEARLRQMLDTALDRSGGLRGIGGDLYVQYLRFNLYEIIHDFFVRCFLVRL